jgi:hypothetical protein
MTDAALPAAPLADDDFRLGSVIARSGAILRRNFPLFFMVSAVANAPLHVSLPGLDDDLGQPAAYFLGLVLITLSQAVVLHAAFQDMQGQRVDLGRSVRIGLRRSIPVIGITITVTLLGFLGAAALLVPGLIVFTSFFVATPACMVEELSVLASMRRSAQLTSGHRWAILSLLALVLVADGMAESTIDALGELVGGNVVLVAQVIWGGIWSAFSAILTVVTYRDLRVAKEGIDTCEIAAVFA